MEEQTSIKCSYCEKSFKNQKSLKIHQSRNKQCKIIPTTVSIPSSSKKEKAIKGQFYTVLSSYILSDLPIPPIGSKIIEPFAGSGELLNWLEENDINSSNSLIEAYDIEPKRDDIQYRDTLKEPPNYNDSWIITNPPYLARNKNENKEIYNMYDC
jgi:hypothetical protein